MKNTVKVYLNGELLEEVETEASTYDDIYIVACDRILEEVDWSYDIVWGEDQEKEKG